MLNVQGLLALLNDKERKLPDFVSRWKGVYFGMSLHIDGACPAFRNLREGREYWVYPTNYFGWNYQYIFDTFLYNKHPRENELTRQWRLSQHRPFTQTPFIQVVQVVSGAVFQDSGYSITVDDKDDNEYIWGANFEGKSLTGYVSDHFKSICEDPNGFFITIPAEPGYKTTTSKIEPKVYYICSKYILWWGEEEVIFEIPNGYTWAVNKLGYFRFKKEGTEGKYVHVDEPHGYYAHMLGTIPYHVCGGIWNGQGFYDSWLTAAKSVADDYVSNKSAKQLIDKEATHPIIVEPSEECPDCTNGYMQWCNTCECKVDKCHCGNTNYYPGSDTPNSYVTKKCSKCGGTGEQSRNPGDRIVAKKEDLEHDLIQIHNHNIDANKYLSEDTREIYQALLRALHLNYIEQAQSGIAKEKDMETRYQFILQVSNDLFDRLINGLLKDILKLRHVTSENGNLTPSLPNYVIIKPTQFQIYTAMDLLLEYQEATKAQMPDYVRAKKLEDYNDKQYGGDDVFKKKSIIITQLDPLALKTEAEKQIVVSNVGDNNTWWYNLQLPLILDQVIREKTQEWFLNASFDDINKEVDRLYKLKPAPQKQLPTTLDQNKV